MAQIEGIEEVIRLINQVGRAPAKVLTAATKKGANIIRNQAKTDAPKDTGALKRSIKLKAEKRKTGKKVYQIKFIGSNLVKFSRSGNRSFYPVSQEYGWTDKNGRRHLGDGKKFLRNAMDDNRDEIKKSIIKDMIQSIRAIVGG